jgi:hypothetical protein
MILKVGAVQAVNILVGERAGEVDIEHFGGEVRLGQARNAKRLWRWGKACGCVCL